MSEIDDIVNQLETGDVIEEEVETFVVFEPDFDIDDDMEVFIELDFDLED